MAKRGVVPMIFHLAPIQSLFVMLFPFELCFMTNFFFQWALDSAPPATEQLVDSSSGCLNAEVEEPDGCLVELLQRERTPSEESCGFSLSTVHSRSRAVSCGRPASQSEFVQHMQNKIIRKGCGQHSNKRVYECRTTASGPSTEWW